MTLSRAIERLESALMAHDIEYARCSALWSRGEADIVDLMCRKQNAEISAARSVLAELIKGDAAKMGNESLLSAAKRELSV